MPDVVIIPKGVAWNKMLFSAKKAGVMSLVLGAGMTGRGTNNSISSILHGMAGTILQFKVLTANPHMLPFITHTRTLVCTNHSSELTAM